MPAPVRTFISIDIPMTDEIEDLLLSLKDVKNVKAVPKEQIHITLKFLGDVYPDKITKLIKALKVSLSDKNGFTLRLKGMGAFPGMKDPRVIWIGIEDCPELMDIAGIVNDTVSSAGLKGDDKPFSPHMTVGRISGRTDIKDIIGEHSDTVFCETECTCVNVMKSELSPKGAKHTVIERIPLM